MGIIVEPNKLLYVVKSKSPCARIDVLEEWIKWLSYVNEEDVKYLGESNKKLKEMTLEEIKKYKNVQEQQIMKELFKKYAMKKCSMEEHDMVYNYMDNSIVDLMNSKINSKERRKIEELLDNLKKQSIDEVEKLIQVKLSDYVKLSKVESYVLHFIIIYNYDRICNQTNEKIEKTTKENNLNLRKKLIKDYGIFKQRK